MCCRSYASYRNATKAQRKVLNLRCKAGSFDQYVLLVICRSEFVSMANETARLRERIGKKVCEILGEKLCISFSGDRCVGSA